ncbi:MAG TPA: tetratricopeptide repeat protein [Polyangiales bacterium]|nr:tetratricopeptide repeat protein [Polyangiales bacterium]
MAAQDDAPPPQYKDLVDRALAESAAQRWPEARALFLQAHAVYPNARTLRGIGMVAFEIRDYVDAIRHLRLALLEPRRALDKQQRAETEKLLDRALSFAALYTLNDLPPRSQIVLDGRPVSAEPDGMLLVPLGQHSVEVRATDRMASAQITVRGGEREPLPVAFEPALAAAAPPASTPAPAPAAAEPAAPPAQSPDDAIASEPNTWFVAQPPTEAKKPFPWPSTLCAVGGGVLLIVGTIVLVSGLSDVDAVEKAQPGTNWSKLQSRYDRAPVMTGAGIGMLAAGGVLTTIGTIGLLTTDSDGDGKTDGVSMRVHGWF